MDGSEIKRRRQAAGMTQAELARAVGVSLRTVGNWERGETPPDAKLGGIERVLGTAAVDAGLTAYDDTELLAELLTRAARRRREERTDEQRPTNIPAHPRPQAVPDVTHRDLRVAYDPDLHEARAADPDRSPTAADLEPDRDDA